ncbi:MAG: choice-of-anchor Q domain-containing protein [Candidatus Udaeobacter sp.]
MGTRGLRSFFRLNALTWWTVVFCAVAVSARATTITVTNTNDNGVGSLRQALVLANDNDTITFAVTGTIVLSSGELLVDKNITVAGPGLENLAVDGNTNSRVFHVAFGTTVTISGLTIRNGMVAGDFPAGSGGGIYSFQSTLTLNDCAISGNSATYGGGVANDAYNDKKGGPWAVLTVNNSKLNGNSASYGGGGIFNTSGRWAGAVLTINNSMLSGNSAGYYGGGVDNNGYEIFGATATLNYSMLSGNSSTNGGGICSSAEAGGYGSLEINNSTVAGNSATYGGGGVFNISYPGAEAFLQISNSTISGDSAQTGGGVDNESDDGGAAAHISNSTFSGNLASGSGGSSVSNSTQDNGGAAVHLNDVILQGGATGGNILNQGGIVISDGYNLSNDSCGGFLTGPGDQTNIDPMLGPLQYNGGPTPTHALSRGSPAIDAGHPTFTPPPFYDQRGPGFDRVVNGHVDIGSFEFQGPNPRPSPAIRPRPTPVPRPIRQ